MNIINTATRYPIGIDISDSAIKIIQLKKIKHKITIQAISRTDIPEGFVSQGIIKKQHELGDIIKKSIEETIVGKITNREAIVCLPETKTFTKLITLKISDQKINDAILDEIEKNVPYRLKEVNYDWQIINKNREKYQILVSVVPKKIAENYYNTLKEAELFPVVLEPEPLAITRALLPINEKNKETTVIIDIGTRHSNFIAYANGSILFTSSIPTSGDNITKAISEKLKISWSQAESAKIVCGLSQLHIKNVVEQELEQKIKKAFKYLSENYSAYGSVTNIYLCGGGAYIKGLPEVLSKKLKIKTEIGHVFTNMNLSEKKENLYFSKEFTTSKKLTVDNKVRKNFSLIFATAIGLALRGVHYEI